MTGKHNYESVCVCVCVTMEDVAIIKTFAKITTNSIYGKPKIKPEVTIPCVKTNNHTQGNTRTIKRKNKNKA